MAVIDLAVNDSHGRVQLREIALRQGIPEKYLEQLLRLLKTGGVVVSTRGSRGGYQLSRPADDLTVLQVIEAVEGSLSPDDENALPARSAALVREVWVEVLDAMRARLGEVTIAALAQRYREAGGRADDWVI